MQVQLKLKDVKSTQINNKHRIILSTGACWLLQATSINVHPVYVTLPATMAASYAFMLPAATPVNALVFSHGHVTVLDMVGDSHSVQEGLISVLFNSLRLLFV